MDFSSCYRDGFAAEKVLRGWIFLDVLRTVQPNLECGNGLLWEDFFGEIRRVF